MRYNQAMRLPESLRVMLDTVQRIVSPQATERILTVVRETEEREAILRREHPSWFLDDVRPSRRNVRSREQTRKQAKRRRKLYYALYKPMQERIAEEVRTSVRDHPLEGWQDPQPTVWQSLLETFAIGRHMRRK